MSNILSSLTNVKEYMKITTSTHDALLTTLLAQASDQIEDYIKRNLVSTVYTDELYDGDGERIFYTLQFPISTAPAAVIVLFDSITNTDVQTFVVNQDYVLHRDEDHFIFWGGVIHGTQNIKITYTAGFATIPPAAVLACNILVFYLFNAIGKAGLESWRAGSYSEKREKVGGTHTTFVLTGQLLPGDVQTLLLPFRKPII
ncbi:hypothetical protein LCGC14_2335980 [marine sediment metagenome]|uniref:Phage gp6-like head-tail connector protein n=1 Tax=marine sediment metagenome TaxID=412755 RepID=A0A0F9D0Y7_9ZZZZ